MKGHTRGISHRAAQWLAGLLVAAGLGGCAALQKDGAPAALTDPQTVRLAADIHLAHSGWPQANWWTRFDDPQLTGLITRALQHAPGMRALRERLLQADAGAAGARAATGLNAAATAQLTRNWSNVMGGNVGPIALDTPIPGVGSITSTVQSSTTAVAGVGAAYAFDFWGAGRSAMAAAAGLANAQLAEQAAAELLLSSAIAQNYFSGQATRQKIVLLERMRAVLADSVAAADARKARGLATDTSASKAREQLLATDQLIAAARAEVIVLREQLRALVGAGADDLPPIKTVALPPARSELPATLSYDLLSHRPDLVALRWTLDASLDRVAIAKAAFYPRVDLKAFLGIGRIDLHDLSVTARQFNLIPGVTLPIFNLDLLNAQLQGARAASNAQIEHYNQAILNAVRDVAVAATGVQAAGEQMKLAEAKHRDVQIGAADASARSGRGLASRVAAEQAGLPVLQDDIGLVDLHAKALAAEVALIQALGGGYDAARADRAVATH